jgi:hypothetical protein
MSKKIKSYNLSKDVIAAISSKAEADDRKDSDWLNRFLTAELVEVEIKPVKTALKPFEAVQYPVGLNIRAWDLWIQFRSKAKFKKYKTDAAMKKLAKMGTENEQHLIVQQSIDNEYQGLFAIKTNNSTGKTSGNLSACEDFING